MAVAPPMNGVTRMVTSPATTLPISGALDAAGPAASSSSDGSCMSSRNPWPPSRSRWKNAATRVTGIRNTAATSTIAPRLALSSRNDPSRRSLKISGCNGSGPVRADPAFGNGGYGDAGYGDGAPHPGAAPPVGPHAGGPHAGGDPPGPVPDPPDGWSGGSQGGGELLTSFLS